MAVGQDGWRETCLERAGAAVGILLCVVGIYIQFAVGATVTWRDHALVQFRHPFYGLLLVLAGIAIRWCLSPTYRKRCEQNARSDRSRVLDYASGGRWVPWRAAFCWVFFPALLVYQSNDRTLGWGDSVPMLQTAVSLLVDGDLALDEFTDPDHPPYYVCRINGHYYSGYNLGPVLIALPFVQVCRWLGGDLLDSAMRRRFEKVIASVVAAASALLMFCVFLRMSRPAAAVVLTIVYALGSQVWSTASQALWQHGPVALSVSAILMIEYHSKHRPSWRLTIVQGVMLGFAAACRPTAAILGAAFAGLVLWRRRRHLGALLAGGVLAYLPFGLIHLTVYQSVLGPYQRFAAAGVWAHDSLTGLAGTLVSPARGLLVYQPWVVPAIATAFHRFRRRIDSGLSLALGGWCIVHLLLVSHFGMWWGGHCWGPRYLTDLMPALVVLAAPVVEGLWSYSAGRICAIVLIAWSVALQATGAYSREAIRWNAVPADVDHSPQRVWEWNDAPFLRPWKGPPRLLPSKISERC